MDWCTFPASLGNRKTLTHFLSWEEYLYYVRLLLKVSIKTQYSVGIKGNWENVLARLGKWEKCLHASENSSPVSLGSHKGSANKQVWAILGTKGSINACFLVKAAQGQRNLYNTQRRPRRPILEWSYAASLKPVNSGISLNDRISNQGWLLAIFSLPPAYSTAQVRPTFHLTPLCAPKLTLVVQSGAKHEVQACDMPHSISTPINSMGQVQASPHRG